MEKREVEINLEGLIWVALILAIAAGCILQSWFEHVERVEKMRLEIKQGQPAEKAQ